MEEKSSTQRERFFVYLPIVRPDFSENFYSSNNWKFAVERDCNSMVFEIFTKFGGFFGKKGFSGEKNDLFFKIVQGDNL